MTFAATALTTESRTAIIGFTRHSFKAQSRRPYEAAKGLHSLSSEPRPSDTTTKKKEIRNILREREMGTCPTVGLRNETRTRTTSVVPEWEPLNTSEAAPFEL